MTEGPAQTTPPIVMVLALGGFGMLAFSAAIWMGYIPFADDSMRRTVSAVVFVAGLVDFGMALYFKNRSR
jgi:hypothetical protein